MYIHIAKLCIHQNNFYVSLCYAYFYIPLLLFILFSVLKPLSLYSKFENQM